MVNLLLVRKDSNTKLRTGVSTSNLPRQVCVCRLHSDATPLLRLTDHNVVRFLRHFTDEPLIRAEAIRKSKCRVVLGE